MVACMVCARPLDSLLTSGLKAGVLVMAVVALVSLARSHAARPACCAKTRPS